MRKVTRGLTSTAVCEKETAGVCRAFTLATLSVVVCAKTVRGQVRGTESLRSILLQFFYAADTLPANFQS